MYKFQTIYGSLYSSTRIKHLKPGDIIIYCNKLALVLAKTNLKRTTKMVLLQNLKTETAIYHKDCDFNKLNKHNVNHVKI